MNRFARQLEIYSERRKAAGELPVSTPTPESVVSLHTVTALLPYEEQFQAVGLAVTSEQQRQKSPPKPSAKKDMKTKNPPDVKAEPISTRPKETRKQAEPGHLQLNGLRSASTSSSDSSTSGTQVAFAQPDAWELAFIDEVPAKKESSTSRCCNLPCFQNTRDQSIDVQVGRTPPAPTPTTIDTPNKILAKWEPIYPQKTEALQGWRKSSSKLSANPLLILPKVRKPLETFEPKHGMATRHSVHQPIGHPGRARLLGTRRKHQVQKASLRGKRCPMTWRMTSRPYLQGPKLVPTLRGNSQRRQRSNLQSQRGYVRNLSKTCS